MNSLLLVILCFIAYIIAYNTYGRFLAKKIFNLDKNRSTPAHTLRDNQDYVPAHKIVLFGHHFTSIAGLGPIVGPAIGVIWGWVPAVLWVVFGSILMGAFHDFGSLVLSIRSKGCSIGDIAGDLINPRVRSLFMGIIFLALWIIIAIFALIIALLFDMYPETVLSIWCQVPIAIWLGWMIYRKGYKPAGPAIAAIFLLYATIVIGSYNPIKMPAIGALTPVMVWMIFLFIVNSFISSVLPVHVLLQPRDFINALQLFIALILIVFGVIVGHPRIIAPAVVLHPVGAPPIWPFLFVIIACGAISGFHSIVSSGTSSKQLNSETDAQIVGYGSMLMESALAILVIIAVTAGIGMKYVSTEGTILTGYSAYAEHYSSWSAAAGLSSKINAFIVGAANLFDTYGIPHKIGLTIIGVFIVAFAATTLDTATRLQRYIISEFARVHNITFLRNRYTATSLAVLSAAALAFYDGTGKGALKIWPLFGTVNQLLAAMALLVLTIYFIRNKKPVAIALLPFIFMIIMTGWAMVVNIRDYFGQGNWLLFVIGLIVFVLEIWMIIESVIVLVKPVRTIEVK
ncbi:MAG: carbon starvation protein A [Candidatus Latescibacteria bacterium]|jgi:carbon starvation protein|nr:carbon starvation protein A [Candidatus Latescibacterota bacterium]